MVSTLYDNVISSTVTRLAAAAPVTCSHSHKLSAGGVALVSITSVLAASLILVVLYLYYGRNTAKYSAVDSNGDDVEGRSSIIKPLV